ncbi:unnamed protein product [Oncorhynchus mykiss]|uniref:Fibronectin type-I domain-containing protein n=1 Tax=Oncorhynchus mykiss TaxID=8022 RepID=A0A060YLD1_ONCMY|nr:unnamed protein product [Oncorhynchus mykiss]
MSSSPMIRVLVVLCIGTAVNCMPNRKSRRQAHQGETRIPSVSSVSQDGCIDNGQMYNINDQWERSYLGTMLVCTCHGVAGIKCKTKPEGESAFLLLYIYIWSMQVLCLSPFCKCQLTCVK